MSPCESYNHTAAIPLHVGPPARERGRNHPFIAGRWSPEIDRMQTCVDAMIASRFNTVPFCLF